MDSNQRLDEGERKAATKFFGGSNVRREGIVEHNAFAAFHDVEGNPHDRKVVAEEIGARSQRKDWMYALQQTGLAFHIVRSGSYGPHWRAAQDAFPRTNT